MSEPLFHILPSDKAFKDSPQEGDPDCFCSRCGEIIPENRIAIRAWSSDGLERRYHSKCVGLEESELDDEPIYNEGDEEGPW